MVLLPPDTNALMQQHQRQNIAARPSSIDIDSKGLPSPGYNESPYGNGNIGDPQPRGDFRFDSHIIFNMIYCEPKLNLEQVKSVTYNLPFPPLWMYHLLPTVVVKTVLRSTIVVLSQLV